MVGGCAWGETLLDFRAALLEETRGCDGNRRSRGYRVRGWNSTFTDAIVARVVHEEIDRVWQKAEVVPS